MNAMSMKSLEHLPPPLRAPTRNHRRHDVLVLARPTATLLRLLLFYFVDEEEASDPFSSFLAPRVVSVVVVVVVVVKVFGVESASASFLWCWTSNSEGPVNCIVPLPGARHVRERVK